MKSFIALLAILLVANTGIAQTSEDFTKTLMPVPLNYTVFKADENIVLDGKDDEKAWGKTAWSEEFSDIEGAGGTRFPYKTKCKFLWDNDFFYVFLRMEEDAVWAVHKKDDIVFRENVLKIFIDPDNNMHNLIEIQINPFNEVHYLTLSKPYRDRGILNAGWMPVGAKSAVGIKGTINDPSDKDTEWTIEMALPLKGINGSARTPQDGSFWRLDIQRTDYDMAVKDGVYSKAVDAAGKPLPQQNTAWSPPGMNDIPFPERWGYISFNQATAGSKTPAFILPYPEQQRRYLWAAYYRQKDWLKKNGRYAETLKELNVPEKDIMIEGKSNSLAQEATSKQFIISISDGPGKRPVTINQDGFVGN
jgi:hypothetical protein